MQCTADQLNDAIRATIDDAKHYTIVNGQAPAVYSARVGRNRYHVGWNLQPVGTQAGDTFKPIEPSGFVAEPIIHWIKQ